MKIAIYKICKLRKSASKSISPTASLVLVVHVGVYRYSQDGRNSPVVDFYRFSSNCPLSAPSPKPSG